MTLGSAGFLLFVCAFPAWAQGPSPRLPDAAPSPKAPDPAWIHKRVAAAHEQAGPAHQETGFDTSVSLTLYTPEWAGSISQELSANGTEIPVADLSVVIGPPVRIFATLPSNIVAAGNADPASFSPFTAVGLPEPGIDATVTSSVSPYAPPEVNDIDRGSRTAESGEGREAAGREAAERSSEMTAPAPPAPSPPRVTTRQEPWSNIVTLPPSLLPTGSQENDGKGSLR